MIHTARVPAWPSTQKDVLRQDLVYRRCVSTFIIMFILVIITIIKPETMNVCALHHFIYVFLSY